MGLHFSYMYSESSTERLIFLISFSNAQAKDRGRRQSIVSVEIIYLFTSLSFPLYLFIFLSCLFFDLNDEGMFCVRLGRFFHGIDSTSYLGRTATYIIISGTGLYLTLRLGFVQIRCLPRALGYLF